MQRTSESIPPLPLSGAMCSVLNGDDPITRRAAIRQVILPEGLRCIKERAFSHCESLTEIIIPSSVEEIGDEAFMHCSQLKEMEFCQESSLCKIESYAFNRCESLTELILPDQVEEIGMESFRYCCLTTAMSPVYWSVFGHMEHPCFYRDTRKHTAN